MPRSPESQRSPPPQPWRFLLTVLSHPWRFLQAVFWLVFYAPSAVRDGLERLRDNSTLRRRILLWAVGITVFAAVPATVVFIDKALTSPASTADRLAAVGDVLVGATLLLAVIAALVALLAYAVSTGPPDLQISIKFDPYSAASIPNRPKFEAEIDGGWILAKTVSHGLSKTTTAKVLLQNRSGYSAKNPAVIIRFRGMIFRITNSEESDWVVADFDLGMLDSAVQWDGGPTYSIHGHSVRRLPDLDLEKISAAPHLNSFPLLIFEILADGYRKTGIIDVDFIVDGKSPFPLRRSEIEPGNWM